MDIIIEFENADKTNEGKQLIANAITDMGVPTSDTDSFATMEQNIRNIRAEPEVNIPDIGRISILFDYDWLVCHIDGDRKYLISNTLIKTVQWNTTDTTTGGYAASNIKKECDQFAIDTGIDQLDYVVDTGVGKVFIPSYDQISGSFSWFNNNSKRISHYGDDPYWYWTSTSYTGEYTGDNVYLVYNDGSINGNFPSGYAGFRPCICIDTTLYNS